MTLIKKYFIIKGVLKMDTINNTINECVAELEALTALIKFYNLSEVRL